VSDDFFSVDVLDDAAEVLTVEDRPEPRRASSPKLYLIASTLIAGAMAMSLVVVSPRAAVTTGVFVTNVAVPSVTGDRRLNRPFSSEIVDYSYYGRAKGKQVEARRKRPLQIVRGKPSPYSDRSAE
jgi:hypothetical protein